MMTSVNSLEISHGLITMAIKWRSKQRCYFAFYAGRGAGIGEFWFTPDPDLPNLSAMLHQPRHEALRCEYRLLCKLTSTLALFIYNCNRYIARAKQKINSYVYLSLSIPWQAVLRLSLWFIPPGKYARYDWDPRITYICCDPSSLYCI
jgi:hypothetical protein